VQMRSNEPMTLLKKDYMSFCLEIIFSYKWIFEQYIFANSYNKCL
jgi:hypothetical protein